MFSPFCLGKCNDNKFINTLNVSSDISAILLLNTPLTRATFTPACFFMLGYGATLCQLSVC